MQSRSTPLKRGANIIIATPGRLMDFMEQGMVDYSKLTTLVLDEADRMLDMGFLPAIRRIVKAVPEKRQTLFFSATMAPDIEKIAWSIVKDPVCVEVSPRGKAAGTIEQTAYPVAHARQNAASSRSPRKGRVGTRAGFHANEARCRPSCPRA